MNQSTKFLLSISAAGAAGVAAFYFANSRFSAGLPGDVILGVGAALSIAGLAVFDYSRRLPPLTVPARLARPAAGAPRPTACGLNPARKDRVAA